MTAGDRQSTPVSATVSTIPLDETAMTGLARGVAGALQVPMTVYFEGELGAGKTTFIRALIQALGHQGRVKSPTYGLMEHYELPSANVVHLDLYRIGDPGELEFLGLADLLGDRTLLLVEWPERGSGGLPPPDLRLRLETGPDRSLDSRVIHGYAHSASGIALCKLFDNSL